MVCSKRDMSVVTERCWGPPGPQMAARRSARLEAAPCELQRDAARRLGGALNIFDTLLSCKTSLQAPGVSAFLNRDHHKNT